MLSQHEKKDKSYFFHIHVAHMENERARTFLCQNYKASNAEKTDIYFVHITRQHASNYSSLLPHRSFCYKRPILQIYGKETVKDMAEPFRLNQKGNTNERSFSRFCPVSML